MVKKNTYGIGIWAGIGFAQFLLFFVFSQSPSLVAIFKEFFIFKQQYALRWFSAVPFSAGDVLYLVLCIGLVRLIVGMFKKNQRRQQLIRLLILMNVVYFLYQINWGMLYFRRPILERTENEKLATADLKKLALEYIVKTNEIRQKLEEDASGNFIIKDARLLEQKIVDAQNRLPTIYRPHPAYGVSNFKASFMGRLMNYTGILGYYNPFTAEAQYNPHLPHSMLPFTLSHESAHQLGFAREQEANFIGYLICERSDDGLLQYSAYLYTARSLLWVLEDQEKGFVKKARKLFSKKVKRDLQKEEQFWTQHRGIVSRFFHLANDLFLKSNRQEGTITYSYYLDLLIEYKKKNHILRCDSKNTNDEKKFIAL